MDKKCSRECIDSKAATIKVATILACNLSAPEESEKRFTIGRRRFALACLVPRSRTKIKPGPARLTDSFLTFGFSFAGCVAMTGKP